MLFHANDLGMLCLQLRPVLIVLELAPLTLRKLKDDKKTREIQNLRKIILTPPPPPNPGGGKGGLSKMAQVPEGEGCFIYILLTAMHLQDKHHLFNGVVGERDAKHKRL